MQFPVSTFSTSILKTLPCVKRSVICKCFNKRWKLHPQPFENHFIIESSLKFVLKKIKKQHCFIWWPYIPSSITCNSNGHKICSPKIFQWNWLHGYYQTIETLYGWWFYILAIKVKILKHAYVKSTHQLNSPLKNQELYMKKER